MLGVIEFRVKFAKLTVGKNGILDFCLAMCFN